VLTNDDSVAETLTYTAFTINEGAKHTFSDTENYPNALIAK